MVRGHENIIGNKEWMEEYPESALPFVSFIMERLDDRVLLFQCYCCGKWSAKADHPEEQIIFPVSNTDRGDTMKWLSSNGFKAVGEVVDGNTLYFN